jgi:hypothetical protein
MPKKVKVSRPERMQVRAQEIVFETPDLYASFGGRVAVAFFVFGLCTGYVLKAIGLALA